MEEPQNETQQKTNQNNIENNEAHGMDAAPEDNNQINVISSNNNNSQNNLTSPKNINEKLDLLENSENMGQVIENNMDMEGINGETADEDNEDLFEGDYEEFEEKSLYGDPGYQSEFIEDYSSIVTNRRTELYKIIVTRQKREFEGQCSFADKSPGEEGNNNYMEIKLVKGTEVPSFEKAVIEMGFQTSNEAYEKSYQVPRMRMQNALTQVEKGLGDIIDKFEKKVCAILQDSTKMNNLENFLHKVRSRMEEALQSNETIDIFQNDFELSRVIQSESNAEKKSSETQIEVRSFRDNLLAGS